MNKERLVNISIIIIGFNTINSLKKLLLSINNQKVNPKHGISCVYVDDCSTDNSFEFFKNYKLKFKKKYFRFTKNSGRVVATQKGIDLANDDWFLFVRSNVSLHQSAIQEFIFSISKYNAIAFMGNIQYRSKDLSFQKYLNHKKRGTNVYQNHQKIHFKHLLFGNSIIHSHVFNKISLNKKLSHYGGEEIDFAKNVLKLGELRFCKRSKAFRNNHPSFVAHTKRLIKMGQFNLQHLSADNQKTILGLCYYFKKYKFLFYYWVFLLWLIQSVYKINFLNLNFYLIRIGLLSSIMIGYNKAK